MSLKVAAKVCELHFELLMRHQFWTDLGQRIIFIFFAFISHRRILERQEIAFS